MLRKNPGKGRKSHRKKPSINSGIYINISLCITPNPNRVQSAPFNFKTGFFVMMNKKSNYKCKINIYTLTIIMFKNICVFVFVLMFFLSVKYARNSLYECCVRMSIIGY